jgi:very-short-patch-repair endonuclease
LGYFVDGYSKEQNIVLEYDEPHHFNSDGNLKESDIIRQNEIEEYLDCTFIRITE